MDGFNSTLGSLTGSGTLFNSSLTSVTLNVGFDNSSTTFSGQIERL